MQIAKILLAPVHLQKPEMEQLARQVSAEADAFASLLALMGSEEPELAARAAWCFSHAAKLRPDWTREHQKAVVDILEKPALPKGVLRNTLRILRDTQLHPDSFDKLAYHCFNFVEDPAQPVAIRAFALHILGQIGCHIADIRPEVKAIIEYHFAGGAPGLKSSAKAVLRLWRKMEAQSGR